MVTQVARDEAAGTGAPSPRTGSLQPRLEDKASGSAAAKSAVLALAAGIPVAKPRMASTCLLLAMAIRYAPFTQFNTADCVFTVLSDRVSWDPTKGRVVQRPGTDGAAPQGGLSLTLEHAHRIWPLDPGASYLLAFLRDCPPTQRPRCNAVMAHGQLLHRTAEQCTLVLGGGRVIVQLPRKQVGTVNYGDWFNSLDANHTVSLLVRALPELPVPS